MTTPAVHLTDRYDAAVSWARELHAEQTRKGTTILYLSHLLAVSARVLEDGGDEDQAIAGLLHDTIEDQGVSPAEIEERFGAEVARIVIACTDADTVPKPPWRERKEAYLLHLVDADEPILRVCAADKLHNVRALLRDLAEHGDEHWERFSAPPVEQAWYFSQLASLIGGGLDSPLSREFVATAAQLVALIQRSGRF